MAETLLSPSNVLLFGRKVTDIKIEPEAVNKNHNPFEGTRTGTNKDLELQLTQAEATLSKRTACFARIYGFSYEGTYFDLPRPMMFLVHGDGTDVTEVKAAVGSPKAARAPGNPSLTGVATADFQFADDIMVWSYDKADYTIRMDVETGMFDQVLLDAFFDGGGGGRVSGAMVSGAMVGGPGARGAMVRGAMVSGAMLRGRRGGRGDPSD